MRFAICFILLLFNFSLQTKTAPLDTCSKLKNKEDQKKCFLKEYETSDKELNQAYRKVREALSESEKQDLKKIQQLWIGYRDGICEGPMYSSDDTGIETIVCKTETTSERTEYLRKVWIFGNPSKDGLGLYTDGFGGILKLFSKKPGGEIRFELEVVRGPTAHIGQIDGIWTPSKAQKWTWTSSPGCTAKDPECCMLEFQSFSNRIEVEELSCSAYHGARAYFDGTYRYKFK